MRRILGNRGAPAAALGIAAVVLAAGGGAYAATRAPATIRACVRHDGGGLYVARHCARGDRALSWGIRGQQGLRGPAGLTGAKGAPGPAGPAGAKGDPGPVTGVLPSGASEQGAFVARGIVNTPTADTAISFPLRLPSTVPAFYVKSGVQPLVPQCPGSAANPKAAAGNLCVYESVIANASFTANSFIDPVTTQTTRTAGPVGVILRAYANLTIAPGFYIYGTWAVTAP